MTGPALLGHFWASLSRGSLPLCKGRAGPCPVDCREAWQPFPLLCRKHVWGRAHSRPSAGGLDAEAGEGGCWAEASADPGPAREGLSPVVGGSHDLTPAEAQRTSSSDPAARGLCVGPPGGAGPDLPAPVDRAPFSLPGLLRRGVGLQGLPLSGPPVCLPEFLS